MVSALNSGLSSQVSRPVIGCVLRKRTLIYSVSPNRGISGWSWWNFRGRGNLVMDWHPIQGGSSNTPSFFMQKLPRYALASWSTWLEYWLELTTCVYYQMWRQVLGEQSALYKNTTTSVDLKTSIVYYGFTRIIKPFTLTWCFELYWNRWTLPVEDDTMILSESIH